MDNEIHERKDVLVIDPLVGGWNDDWTFEEGAHVSMQGGNLVISIAEEQAVDSYNSTFTCSLTLSPAAALKLAAWIVGRYEGR